MTCCPEDALCEMHLEDRYMQLRGVAASRAHAWVVQLFRRRAAGTWDAEKALRIARRKVADLARDPALAGRLAVECERCAREEWVSRPPRSR